MKTKLNEKVNIDAEHTHTSTLDMQMEGSQTKRDTMEGDEKGEKVNLMQHTATGLMKI